MTTPKRRAPIRLNALTVGILTRALLDGPHTLYELRDLCGLGLHAIRRYIKAMQASKAAYVAQWEQDSLGRYVMPAYQIGVDKRNAQRPPRERTRKRKARAARDAQMLMNQMLAGKIAVSS